MKPERMQEIVDELQGSCKSIEDCLESGESQDNEDLLALIDEQIFECSSCGWWCEIGEAEQGSDGDMCQDCSGND